MLFAVQQKLPPFSIVDLVQRLLHQLPQLLQLLREAYTQGLAGTMLVVSVITALLFAISLLLLIIGREQQLLGQERLIFSSGYLIVRKDLFGIGLNTYFAADSITDFTWRAEPAPSGAGAGSGTHISFRYQQETITCGTNVTSEEGEQIHQQIQQQALNKMPDADLLAQILAYVQATKEKLPRKNCATKLLLFQKRRHPFLH